MRISHKDHLHPSTKNWTAKCKRHMDETGEPIVMDGFHTGNAEKPKAMSETKTVAVQQVNNKKSLDLADMDMLSDRLAEAAVVLDKVGLEAYYRSGKWTLKFL